MDIEIENNCTHQSTHPQDEISFHFGEATPQLKALSSTHGLIGILPPFTFLWSHIKFLDT